MDEALEQGLEALDTFDGHLSDEMLDVADPLAKSILTIVSVLARVLSRTMKEIGDDD